MGLRFFVIILSSAFFVLFQAIPTANDMIAHKDRFSEKQRYCYACVIMDYLRRRSRTETESYGKELLPKRQNFILYSNHQGKYDALGILLSLDQPCSVLWEHKSAGRILTRQVVGLLDCVTINLSDMRAKGKAIIDVIQRVKKGKNFLIFPEGTYGKNHNHLQEFQSGCFTCSIKTRTPIVPVAIYDTYKSMNGNRLKRVKNQVYFLEPIYYEEYRGLNKKEIAKLVKQRIDHKLREIDEMKEKNR